MNNLIVNQVSSPSLLRLQNDFTLFCDVSSSSSKTYARAIKRMVDFFQRQNISKPTRQDLLAYKKELLDTCKPTTTQNYITAMKLFYSWTSQQGLYPNIAEHLKGIKIAKEFKKDYLTSKQVKSLVASVESIRDKAIIVLTVTTGLRTIELARADKKDLRTLGDNVVLYIQGKGKTDKSDFVKIAPQVEVIIREYLSSRTDNDTALFIGSSNAGNGRMTTRSISRIIKNNLIKAGFNSDRLTAHSLRHTAITLALLGGEDIQQVQQLARHSNINTTMIYNHSIDKASNTCSSTIANNIF